MAQGISLISGSPLIGSPIVYRVVPAPYSQNRTFHRIIVRVYAGLAIPPDSEQLSDEDYTIFDFSTPVETKSANGGFTNVPSLFDISSALQAVADKYAYAATPPERYPYIKFRIEAWDEWMIDGTVYSEQGVVQWPSLPVDGQQFYGYAFMGAWTDLERMNANVSEGVEYLDTLHMSRKPTSSPEVVFLNTPIAYAVDFERSILDTDHMSEGADPRFVDGAPDDGPKTEVTRILTGGKSVINNREYYAIGKPHNAYEIRFVNGFGCVESLHVSSPVVRETDVKTNEYIVSGQETLKKFSRLITTKTAGNEVWTLSSGPIDRDWANWYIHEFIQSKQAWIWLQTAWIACHVLSEDTIVIEDQTKSQIYEVRFKLKMELNGSPTTN